jgi:hypothetical protein
LPAPVVKIDSSGWSRQTPKQTMLVCGAGAFTVPPHSGKIEKSCDQPWRNG